MNPRGVKITLAVWYVVLAAYFAAMTVVSASFVTALTESAFGAYAELWNASGIGPYLLLNCVLSAGSGLLVLFGVHETARGCSLLLAVLLGMMGLDAYRLALGYEPANPNSIFTLALPAFGLHACLYYFLLISERRTRRPTR